MAIASINIKAAKPSSEAHNKREVELDYVLKDVPKSGIASGLSGASRSGANFQLNLV
jgi:hypothetical protein